MDGTRPGALSDSQLDRELEAALGVEPSPEFLPRVRARLEVEPRRFAVVRGVLDPMFLMGAAGIILAIVVPHVLRPPSPPTPAAVVSDRTVSAIAPQRIAAAAESSRPKLSSRSRRRQAQPALLETAELRGSRRRSFDEQILLAPADREAFARLLIIVNDPSIELVAPVLESTRAAADIFDAAINVPALAAPEGVSQ